VQDSGIGNIVFRDVVLESRTWTQVGLKPNLSPVFFWDLDLNLDLRSVDMDMALKKENKDLDLAMWDLAESLILFLLQTNMLQS